MTVLIADSAMALLASRVTLSLPDPSPVPVTLAMPRTEILPSVSRVTVSVPVLPITVAILDTLTAAPDASRVTVSVPLPPIRLAMFDTRRCRR